MENRLVSRIKSDRKCEIRAGEACDIFVQTAFHKGTKS
jgi:hypothetical protein